MGKQAPAAKAPKTEPRPGLTNDWRALMEPTRKVRSGWVCAAAERG